MTPKSHKLTNRHWILQIFKQMDKSQDQPDHAIDPQTFQRIETSIQEKVNAGYTAPCGWLFRGLKFLFYANRNPQEKPATRELRKQDQRLSFAHNTARFAGAASATSLKSAGITHVIIDPGTLSSADLSSLRSSLAEKPGNKMPHLVSVEWVEECWKNGTILDEERKL
jgi:DNA ligase-4